MNSLTVNYLCKCASHDIFSKASYAHLLNVKSTLFNATDSEKDIKLFY